MKVLHISTYQTGGAARSLQRIHEPLRRAGIDSQWLVLYKTIPAENVTDYRDHLSLFKKLSKKVRNKMEVMAYHKKVMRNGRPTELISSPVSCWDITTHPLYHQADIVHLHWVAGFVDVPSFFNTIQKPLVITLHDHFLITGSYHYPFAGMERFATLVDAQEKLMQQAYRKCTPAVIAPSQDLLKTAQESGVFQQATYHRLPTGLNQSVFHYRDKKTAGDGITKLLFVADDIAYARKGFHLLYEALKDLPEVRLTVIGKNKNTFAHPQVVFAGEVNSDAALAELYAAADLFICPSLDDNFPNTVLEALFCGTPAVVLPAGGTPEMVAPQNGVVANGLQPADLSTAILQAMDTKFDRKLIADAAFEKYSDTVFAQQHLDLYRQLI